MNPSALTEKPIPKPQTDGYLSPRVVLLNAFSNYLYWFLRMGVVMVLVRLNTTHLDRTDYGFWVWLWSIFSAVFLLDFGLGFSLARFIPPAYARGDMEDVRQTISGVFWFFAAGSLVILAGGLVASVVLPMVVEDFRSSYRTDFILFTVLTVISFPSNVFRDALFGFNRIALRNSISMAVDLSSFAVVCALYSLGFGLRMLVLTMGLGILIRNLISLCFCWRILGVFPVDCNPASIRRIRSMFSFSFFTYLTSLSNLALKTVSVTIIGFFSLAAAGTYNPPRSLSVYFEDLGQQFQLVLPPVVGRLSGDHGRQSEIFLRLSRLVLYLGSILYIPLIAHVGVLLPMWVPNLDNLAIAVVVAKVLVTKAFLVVIFHSPAQAVLLLAGRHRAVAVATSLGAAAAVVLSLAAWILLDMGILGVALGFTLGPLLGGLLLLPEGWRFASVSLWGYLQRVVLPNVAPVAVLGLGHLVGFAAFGAGWTARICISGCALLLSLGVYAATVTEDRNVVARFLRRRAATPGS